MENLTQNANNSGILDLNSKKFLAFSLIELLVVTVVIGILATISVATFNGYFAKARAAKIANDLKLIEKSFKLSAIQFDRETYPHENTWGTELVKGSSVKLEFILEKNQLVNLPEMKAESFGLEFYAYDNDKDTYTYLDNCPSNASASTGGANIIVLGTITSTKIRNELDKIFDNSDGFLCGKIRAKDDAGSGILYYSLSDNL